MIPTRTPAPGCASRTPQTYGLPYQCLYRWYRRGLVRGWRTPAGVLVDAASIEEALLPPGWEWLSEALKRCGLGRYVVLRLIRAGRLRARRVRQRRQVETASLEECARERALPAGWVGTSDAGRRLGVGRQEIRRRIRAGQLRAEKRGRRWAVAESSIEAQLPPPGWITTQEAARRTGWASSTIGLRIRKGLVAARKIGKRWFVEERSLLAPAAPPGWITLRQAAGETGLAVWKLYKLVRGGALPARKVGKCWFVERESLRQRLASLGVTSGQVALSSHLC